MRCFIALEVPADIQSQLGRLIDELRSAAADVKWVDPKNIHLTLKFLGEISDQQVSIARAQLELIRGDHHALSAQLSGLGAFPSNKRPQIIWAGLEIGPGIDELVLAIETAMGSIGFPRESRGFKPHLTLGRVRSPRNLQELAQRLAQTVAASAQFRMAALSLFQSTLTPAGSIYQPLTTIGLE